MAKQRQKRFQLHPTIGIRERLQRKLLVQKTERKRIIVPMKDVIKHGLKRFLRLGISIQNSEIKKQPHAEKMATVEIFIGKDCGQLISKGAVVKATGHSWDSGKVTEAATCKKEGTKTYTCKNCGETKTESIPKTEHQWDNGKVTKEATCKEEGSKIYTCSICGDAENRSNSKERPHMG